MGVCAIAEKHSNSMSQNSPGNAENADIAVSAGNGKRRTPNAERFPISTD
jgi:hypothetical protein